MTAAILYAFASAGFLGAGSLLAQLGLRTVEPLSGAAISVPSFTLLFLLLSPLILQGEPVVWRGLPIFVAIGLFFPASLTLLTFASNRALGPVITSTLGNLAPLFAVALAVILLHEPLQPPQLAWPRHRGRRRRDHHRDPPARPRPLAKLGAAAAARAARWCAAWCRRSSSSGSRSGRARSGPA